MPVATPARHVPARIATLLRACAIDLKKPGAQLVYLPVRGTAHATRADLEQLCAVLEDCGGIWNATANAYVFDPRLLMSPTNTSGIKAKMQRLAHQTVFAQRLLDKVAETQTTIPPRSDPSL